MVARKTAIKDILGGEPVAQGENTPAGWRCASGEFVAQVHLVGTIVAAADDGQSYALDDGTGHILLRVFDARKSVPLSVGQLVRAIGRPREFGDPYIALEVCKPLSDPAWFELHKKETVSADAPAAGGGKESLLGIIRELDTGTGAAYEQIVSRFGEKTDALLRKMLSDGEVFETAPGRIKVLE